MVLDLDGYVSLCMYLDTANAKRNPELVPIPTPGWQDPERCKVAILILRFRQRQTK
jgi:hypothetical protein